MAWPKRKKRRSVRPLSGNPHSPELPDNPESDGVLVEAELGSSIEEQLDGDPEPVITLPMVRERALRLLAAREHGRKELQQKLLQRDLPPDLVTSVLDKLAEEGLQCDARFAESYTRMRIGRGHGANKVRADLQSRHVESSIIDSAIRDSGADWAEIAFEALDKKFGASTDRPDHNARAKMQRYLYRRGFESAEIKSAITKLSTTETDW